MTVYHLMLLVVLLLFGASCARKRHDENETVRKLRIFESKLQKLETEIQAYPSTNSTSDRLERLEVLVNLLSEDVYNVRVDQELLKRDIMERLKEIEDKISEIRPPVGPSGWIQFMIADHYRDFRPVRNYSDDDMPKVHSDCKDAYDKGWTNSGIYRISLSNGNEIDVFCDQGSSNGGWIVIQRRIDGSINFGRTWEEYRNGFGDISGEFWIGNQNLHAITAGQDTRLRIEVQYLTDGFTEIQYREFWVEGERDLYRLHISGFDGSEIAGDSLSYHDGMYFSAVDSDYDHSFTNCALRHGGGWWHNDCTKANLNGVYTSQAENGMFWRTWTGYSNTLKSITMMVRGSNLEVNSTFTDGDLRLMNPSGSLTEGRLEMVLNDTWGSICDDSFDDIDALVACRQLGFQNGTYRTTKIPGSGPIWLDELRCSSYHTRLLDCPHSGIGNHNCGHYEDVYIACHNNPEGNGSYVNGDLRLVHPNSRMTEGRLEIIFDDTWGTVCDDNFDDIDAMVACKQLGYENGTYQTTKIPGSGPIWLDDLRCSPYHTRLSDCPNRGVGIHDCSHIEDVYIACHNNPEVNGSHIEGDLRLVNPNGKNMEGRLEIYVNATWGTICDDFFDNIDAMVACKQIGFSNGMYLRTNIPGSGPIWLSGLRCSSYHTRLLDCPHSGIGNHNCNHNGDAYIACYDTVVNGSHVNGDLRLVKPSGTDNEGRLEVLLNNAWGTICDTSFDNIDAMVACRQLGFDNGVHQDTKLPGTGPIWLDYLRCSLSHKRLVNCPHRGIGVHYCDHSRDVFVTCYDNPGANASYPDGDLRLVGPVHPSINKSEGRLEVMWNNTWGSVCSYSFDYIDARVACRQMGFSIGTYIRDIRLPGTGPIWLDRLECNESHQRLIDCPHSGMGENTCNHEYDVYIGCYSGPQGGGDLRLVHPTNNQTEGRLEVRLHDTWGTVCNFGFDTIDAIVVCKQLGYTTGTELNIRLPGTGPIWLQSVRCSLSHKRLLDCPHGGVGETYCSHSSDTYVACYDPPDVNGSYVSGDLRLLSTNDVANEGILEIFLNGFWGTICHDYFDKIDATVACKQMGFADGIPLATRMPGTGPIWLYWLQCRSNQTQRLVDCPHFGIGTHSCHHGQDVYVACYDGSRCSDLRIVPTSNSQNTGRLEVLFNGTWGTIGQHWFDKSAATVACKQLGFADGIPQATEEQGTGPLWLQFVERPTTNYQCLDDIPHSGVGAAFQSHYNDAHVQCYSDASSRNCSELRLVNSNGSHSEGRLEMLISGEWGTICQRFFDKAAATVACKQLGFASGIPKATRTQGTGEVWLSFEPPYTNYQCLEDFPHSGVGRAGCSHRDDVYVACYEDSSSRNCSKLRLVHPTGCRTEGRLEIEIDGIWGSVNRFYFDNTDATVACQQIGFTRGRYLSNRLPGTGPIWLDYLQCTSSHQCLDECPHYGVGNTVFDDHDYDVYIACYNGASREDCPGGYNADDGSLRLVHPGGCNTEGRLEINHQKTWGTVCNSNFDDVAATVACKQLGFMHGVRIEWESAGEGTIWLDDIRCTMNDTSLMDCAHKPVGTHSCGHQQDVHIACFGGSRKECCSGPDLHDAVKRNVRLVGGTCPDEGRLEIFHDNSWGTICKHSFGTDEATVVCREMGYHSGVPMKAPSPGAGTMWKLSCSLNHRSIEDCTTTHLEGTTCTHEHDAGVVCFYKP